MGWRLGARGWSQNEDSSSIWPQPQASSPIASKLAGAEGFEPPNGGIKTRCLTTWRRPNFRSNRLDAVVELQAMQCLLNPNFAPRPAGPKVASGSRF